MGSDERNPLRIITRWPESGCRGSTILCPCLARLPRDTALYLGILPIHDANGQLLDELGRANGRRPPEFAGICFADPFRRLDDLLDLMREAGIDGVVNLPTVAPFLRYGSNEVFARLHEREEFALAYARKRGFCIKFVTTSGNRDNVARIALDELEFHGS